MSENPIALGLPHRHPFIFVERVIDRTPGESATAEKSFPASTPFFGGHFPGAPLVPGVILTEAIAQVAGLAAGQAEKSFRLAAVKGMKFPNAAFPDELIRIEVRRTATVGSLWQFEGRATVGDRVVAEGVVVLSEV